MIILIAEYWNCSIRNGPAETALLYNGAKKNCYSWIRDVKETAQVEILYPNKNVKIYIIAASAVAAGKKLGKG